MVDEGYSPMTDYLDSLKKKIAGLEAQLKEKDFHIEQEVVYKLEEIKKVEALSTEVNQLKKQLAFHLAFNKNGKEKIFELVDEVLKFYGKKIEQKKPH
jgi:hypothetical protein